MTAVQKVIQTHAAHPEWTVPDIARELGLSHIYVRTVVVRKSLPVPKAAPGRKRVAA